MKNENRGPKLRCIKEKTELRNKEQDESSKAFVHHNYTWKFRRSICPHSRHTQIKHLISHASISVACTTGLQVLLSRRADLENQKKETKNNLSKASLMQHIKPFHLGLLLMFKTRESKRYHLTDPQPYISCRLQQSLGVCRVPLPCYIFLPQQQLSSSMVYVSGVVPQQFVLSKLSPSEMVL